MAKKKCKPIGKKLNKETTVLIGSDSEFLFYDHSRRIGAEGVLGSPDTRAQLGTDGCSAIGEIRPKESSSPLVHAKNIKKLIYKMRKICSKQKLRVMAGAGTSENAIGGHIHFNIPNEGDVHYLIDSLDCMAIYLMSFDEPSSAKRRKCGSYGRLGEYRGKSYGFEYRPLSSWISNEWFAKGVLCMAYSLGWDYQNTDRQLLKKISGYYQSVIKRTKGGKNKLVSHYVNHDVEYFKKIGFNKKFEGFIRKSHKYSKYRDIINCLFSHKKLETIVKVNDVVGNWKLRRNKEYETSRTSIELRWNNGDHNNKELSGIVGNFLLEFKNGNIGLKPIIVIVYGLKKSTGNKIKVPKKYVRLMQKKKSAKASGCEVINSGSSSVEIGLPYMMREAKESKVIRTILKDFILCIVKVTRDGSLYKKLERRCKDKSAKQVSFKIINYFITKNKRGLNTVKEIVIHKEGC